MELSHVSLFIIHLSSFLLSIQVPTIPSSVQPAHHLAFTPDSTKLLLATKAGGVQVLTVEGPDGVDCPQPLVQSLPLGGGIEGPFLSLAVSGDGQRIAVVDKDGKVAVVPLDASSKVSMKARTVIKCSI